MIERGRTVSDAETEAEVLRLLRRLESKLDNAFDGTFARMERLGEDIASTRRDMCEQLDATEKRLAGEIDELGRAPWRTTTRRWSETACAFVISIAVFGASSKSSTFHRQSRSEGRKPIGVGRLGRATGADHARRSIAIGKRLGWIGQALTGGKACSTRQRIRLRPWFGNLSINRQWGRCQMVRPAFDRSACMRGLGRCAGVHPPRR
jgi:hypothetical protein